MTYYHSNTDKTSVKIIAWFISCILTGAFLFMMIENPNEEMVVRRIRIQRNVNSRRWILEDETEFDYEYSDFK